MKTNSRLLVRRILRLRRIQLDLDGFLGLVHIENLSESLVALRNHLNSDLPLWDGWDLGHAFLVGPHLPGLADLFPKLHLGAAAHEIDHNTCAIHGAAVQRLDFNGECRHRWRSPKSQVTNEQQTGKRNEDREDLTHPSIIPESGIPRGPGPRNSSHVR